MVAASRVAPCSGATGAHVRGAIEAAERVVMVWGVLLHHVVVVLVVHVVLLAVLLMGIVIHPVQRVVVLRWRASGER